MATDDELRASLILRDGVDQEEVAIRLAQLRRCSVPEARERLVSSTRELRDYFGREPSVVPAQRKPTAPEPVQSVVYFVEAVGLGMVKIGWTLRIKTRLRTLQCASPSTLRLVGVAPGGHKDERVLHKMLRRHRVRGEWFTFDSEIDHLIDRLKARVS